MEPNREMTPLPFTQLFTVFMVQFGEGNNINVLFPFLAFMVEEFGYTGHQLGYHAGALAGTFCAAQFFSAVLWGKFSDEYGRKPGIILGVIGAAIGMLVLGFSKTFLQAILGRALCGFLSGNIGVIKSFLTEITDDTNRGKGFSFMQLGWSLGTICGPLAGGLLCYPASKYPKFFSESGVFVEFPFLLPCLLCAIVNIFTAFYCFFFMTESRKLPRDQSTSPTSVSNYSKVLDDQDEEEAVALWSDEMDSSLHGNADPEEPREARRSLLKGILPNFSFGSASEGYSQLTTKESSFSEPHEDLEFGTNGTDTSSQISNDSISFLPLASDETSSECEHRASLSDALTDDTSVAEDDRILNPQAVNAILCYGLCCMAFIVMDESLPLMLKLDSQEGGLSFTSSQIGTLLSTGGIAMLVWSVTLLPTVASRSKLLIFRVSTLIGIPIALSYPILASFRNEIFELFGKHLGHNIIFCCLFLSITARNCLSTSIFMTVIIFVNHSAYDYQLGTINGIGQTVAAAARSVGPALGGLFWSLSVKLHFLYINYLLSIFLFLVMYWISFSLPSSIDQAKVKKNTHSSIPQKEEDSIRSDGGNMKETEIEMISHH